MTREWVVDALVIERFGPRPTPPPPLDAERNRRLLLDALDDGPDEEPEPS